MTDSFKNFCYLFILTIFIASCATPPREITPSQTQGAQGAATPAPAFADGVASRPQSSNSVTWTAPSTWQTGPEKAMRAATYLIPAAAGDPEGAECAVFKNIGGGVDANIKRWIGQFEQPDGSSSDAKARRKTETINGLSVTTVDLTGVFAGGGMAMGQPSVKKNGYRLLGAIVEAPSGEIFFKLTGPAKTVAASEKDFQSMIKSVKK